MNLNGWVAGALIGGVWNIFVIFGLQWAVNPVMINNISSLGYDYIVPLTCAANFGMAGATLGTFIRTKDKKMKAYSISALLSIFFAGITEPAIYGIGIRYKKPLIGAVAGGAVGGAIIGGMRAKAFAFVFGGLTTLPAFVGKTFIPYCVGLLACFVVGCLVTAILGIDEDHADQKVANVDGSGSVQLVTNETIAAPISGNVQDLTQAHDPAFANGSMGDGMVVQPDNGNVYAPFDGEVTMLFGTKHALGLTSSKGTQLMIHIGIDTVKLNGQYFESFVKQGDHVSKGQKLLHFDLDAIEKAGYDCSTVVIVTNTNDYNEVKLLTAGKVKNGTEILQTRI